MINLPLQNLLWDQCRRPQLTFLKRSWRVVIGTELSTGPQQHHLLNLKAPPATQHEDRSASLALASAHRAALPGCPTYPPPQPAPDEP